MAAQKETLEALHEAVAQDLIRRVASGEASAAELSTAVRFLKDNNIEALASANDGLSELIKNLPDFSVEDNLH